MGDPNSRKKQALNRLRAQLRKKKESLADQFDFKMYIAFVFKDKVTWFLFICFCVAVQDNYAEPSLLSVVCSCECFMSFYCSLIFALLLFIVSLAFLLVCSSIILGVLMHY